MISQDNNYKEDLEYIIKNTKQIHFYSNEIKQKENHDNLNSIQESIKIDSTELRLNCCKICKYIFNSRVVEFIVNREIYVKCNFLMYL
jgi:hypothetical protein